MHEYSVVQALFAQVGQEALAHAGIVRRVHVAVGELSGLDCVLFETAYETFRAQSACADAELCLRKVPARWVCPECNKAVGAGALLRCESCHIPAVLSGGAELVLERIEMEVPDV